MSDYSPEDCHPIPFLHAYIIDHEDGFLLVHAQKLDEVTKGVRQDYRPSYNVHELADKLKEIGYETQEYPNALQILPSLKPTDKAPPYTVEGIKENLEYAFTHHAIINDIPYKLTLNWQQHLPQLVLAVDPSKDKDISGPELTAFRSRLSKIDRKAALEFMHAFAAECDKEGHIVHLQKEATYYSPATLSIRLNSTFPNNPANISALFSSVVESLEAHAEAACKKQSPSRPDGRLKYAIQCAVSAFTDTGSQAGQRLIDTLANAIQPDSARMPVSAIKRFETLLEITRNYTGILHPPKDTDTDEPAALLAGRLLKVFPYIKQQKTQNL